MLSCVCNNNTNSATPPTSIHSNRTFYVNMFAVEVDITQSTAQSSANILYSVYRHPFQIYTTIPSAIAMAGVCIYNIILW